MKTTLDAAVVAAAEPPPGKRRLDLYCSQTRGLVLEVRGPEMSRKTYHVRYTNEHGKLRQMKVARADTVTFEQARKAARRLLAAAALGHDPSERKATEKAVPTYGELAAQHLDDARLHQRAYATTAGNMRNHILPR